jgi:hypothetical protein
MTLYPYARLAAQGAVIPAIILVWALLIEVMR